MGGGSVDAHLEGGGGCVRRYSAMYEWRASKAAHGRRHRRACHHRAFRRMRPLVDYTISCAAAPASSVRSQLGRQSLAATLATCADKGAAGHGTLCLPILASLRIRHASAGRSAVAPARRAPPADDAGPLAGGRAGRALPRSHPTGGGGRRRSAGARVNGERASVWLRVGRVRV